MIEMEMLNKIIENRKTKVYILNLTKLLHFQCETFNKYGHLNGIEMSGDIEIFKYFNNRQSFIYYKLFDFIINYWNMFKILAFEFVSKIRYACVYDRNSAILVNDDDDTFIIENENIEKIPTFCKKGICDFSFGFSFGNVIALNRSGQIFGYGTNNYKQILNCDEISLKNGVKISFNSKVKQIECGWYHTMVLTDNNDIFTWGKNDEGQCGTGTNEIVESPFNVKINENSNIKSIVCGNYHSLVLYDNGIVYGWGFNGFGQLGLGTNDDQLKPIKILENIKQIDCGYNHTLALTNDGIVYAMGYNRHGQLGNGNTNSENIPIKIETKFKEISVRNYVSMGMDFDGECYVWGFINNSDILIPTKVENYKSLDEIFGFLGITNKTIQIV
jgi:RCC1 and BTB domain-containing protein